MSLLLILPHRVPCLPRQLHTAAAGYAADGEVCCFQLITLAQEFLQQHNCPPEDEASEPAAPQSLWHEMLQVRAQMGLGSHMRDNRTARLAAVTTATLQRAAASCVQWALAVGELLISRPPALSFPLLQRDLAAAAEHETSYRAPMMGDTVYDALGGGLFSDAAELTVIGSGAVAAAAAAVAVPVMEVRSKAGSKMGRTKPPLHPAAAAAAPKAAAAAKGPSLPASAAADLPSLAVSAPSAAEQASPFASFASSAAGSPKAADAAAAAAAAPSLTAKPASRISPAVGSSGKQVSAPDSGMSVGGGGSMLKTLGHSLRHMLPRPLRKYLDGGWLGCCAGQRGGAGLVCLGT